MLQRAAPGKGVLQSVGTTLALVSKAPGSVNLFLSLFMCVRSIQTTPSHVIRSMPRAMRDEQERRDERDGRNFMSGKSQRMTFEVRSSDILELRTLNRRPSRPSRQSRLSRAAIPQPGRTPEGRSLLC